MELLQQELLLHSKALQLALEHNMVPELVHNRNPIGNHSFFAKRALLSALRVVRHRSHDRTIDHRARDQQTIRHRNRDHALSIR
jgi:hypothetical protein